MTATLVGVVDYGLGNLPSVTKALERVGAEARLLTAPSDFERPMDAVVLPGVGHFGAGARNLTELGFAGPLTAWAASGQPLLGICLGLQLLFARSEEDPDARGLGIVEGAVRRIKVDAGLKVPHMGWNSVAVDGRTRVVGAIDPGDYVYFVHSYVVEPDASVAVGHTEYGATFCSAVEQGNVVGVQFHPEKSADVGRKLLDRFCRRAA